MKNVTIRPKLLYLSIILNILLVGFFVGKRIYYSRSAEAQPSALPDKTYGDLWNRGRGNVLSIFKIDSGDVVFVGNSITEGFPIAEAFGPKAKNRGISANTSYHLAKRIEQIAEAKPAKIIIEIGINDFRENITPDSVLQNIAVTVNKIQAVAPSTQIIFNSVFPTSGTYFMLQPQVEKYNGLLKEYCTQKQIVYVDVYNTLYNGKELDSAYTYDGLHLNGAGYKIWEQKIKPYL